MAGGQERILRRRIKSVESTKKITRAMELIAATRVVKAQDRANAARPYSAQITNVVQDLVRVGAGGAHPLMRPPADGGEALIVTVSTDRGLCGAYNSTVIRMTERMVEEHRAAGRNVRIVVVGKKALGYFKFRGYEIADSIQGVTDQPTYEDARAIANTFRPAFEAGELTSVEIVYWHFLSAGSQEAVRESFLPIEPDANAEVAAADGPSADMEYEPSPDGILDELLPRYLESRVFAALLEASASEHAARQRAMKAATDNAEELKKNLTRIMNRARQDSITTEIMEIVGGAEALKSGKGSSEDLIPDHLVIQDLFPGHLDPLDHGASRH